MKLIFQRIKSFFKKYISVKKGEINYAQFEKLESKKYRQRHMNDDPCFTKHHPYHCTDQCFRKR